MQQSQQQALLARNGLSPHLNAMVAACHTDTFFTMRGLDTLAHTATGTRPGDPCGDILFNWMFLDILQQVRRDVEVPQVQTILGTLEPAFASRISLQLDFVITQC